MRHTRAFYESYQLNGALLRQRLRELELAGVRGDETLVLHLRESVSALRLAMAEVYDAIEGYVPDDCPGVERRRLIQEQLFLRYYYILGLSMEESAEMMDVSRDTVYRVRKRAEQPARPVSSSPRKSSAALTT